MRIIVLEDNDNLRTVLSELLSSAGYEVFTFSSPSICPIQRPDKCSCAPGHTCADVIISDLGMPGMDGLRFMEILKKKNCRCRHMAVMSGLWKNDKLRQAELLGCKTLWKPFQADSFFKWLKAIEKKIDPHRKLFNLFLETNSAADDI